MRQSETITIRTSAPIAQRVRHLLTAGFVTVCLLACAGASAAPAHAENAADSAPGKTVTVAYYEDGDYMLKSDDGTYSGYNIDYLNEIARYADWSYEYVDFDTWEQAYDAIASGSVDILPSVYHSDRRDADMLFSKTPVCSIYTAISVRPDDERFAYDDYEAFQGMKVGVIEGGLDAIAFDAYCKENGLTVEVVPYGETPLLTDALDRGELDAIAITYLGVNTQYKTVAQFSPEPLYIAVAADEADLKAAIDEATDRLLIRNPDYFTELYETYFSMNTKQDPVFTRDEYDYIESAPTLTVVYDSFRTPLAYTDPATGEYAGVTAMLFADIARITGLRFTYVPVENHDEAIALVESGEADIVYAVDQSVELSSSSSIRTTGPYLKDPMAKIVGSNPTGNRVALPEGFSLAAEIAEDSQGHESTYYKTPKQCFDAILDGKADMAYADIHVADYLLSEPQYDSLSLLALTDYTNNMSIGVSPAADPLLVSILDRCVQFTSEATMTRWITETALVSHPTSPTDIIRQYPLQIIGSLALLFLAATGIFVYIYRSKARNAERIARLVYTDPLTGGWNLNRFQIEASRVLESDTAHAHAMLFFDISRFKNFNAAFGYAEGDRLLVAMGTLLERFVGVHELVARVSADQFVALLSWTNMDDFERRFERLDEELNELDILKRHRYRVLVFGGIATLETESEARKDPISELIDCARYARESIGEASRSTVARYSSNMKERDIEQRTLQGEAVAALANGEFVAYYQPKVAVGTGKIVSLEALVRWVVPGTGIRNPIEFIELFERNGFVVEVDFCVFRQACAYIKERIDAGLPIVPIACNFSRLHLLDDRFPSKLKRIVDEYGVPVDLLELELTESIVMEDLARAESMCRRLKELGFQIAIDDFGSGYSSLGALQHLPIDVLKIDRSLLVNSENGQRSKIIFEGIIEMSNRLDVSVIVEGVETSRQESMLEAYGANLIIQGYLYSKPVARAESEAQLDAGALSPNGADRPGDPSGAPAVADGRRR